MFKKVATTVFSALLLCFVVTATHTSAVAATLDSGLASRIGALADDAPVGIVIVAFNTGNGLQNQHLDLLRGLGIVSGTTLNRLGMVAVPATAGQVRALVANSSVRSVYENRRLTYFMDQARVLTGADRARTDAAFTKFNGGLPVSGSGNFSVVINDSGIDATHGDLTLGNKVIQNVQIVTDTETVSGFTPLLAVENVPNTDSVGHGTHCAGIVGGTGQMSGGRYAGVAPGAKIVGCGSGAVLFVLNALGGFEYALANQDIYKVRVISCSFGSHGPFEPDNPLNIASYIAYQNNISVVFAAGNSGPTRNSHNPYAKAPWVISVAAGTKEGGLATFSSRGTRASVRLGNADPNDDFDAPTITAPGTGREFEANATKFSAAIVSTRAKTNIFTNGLTDDAELSPAHVPFYTQISGTSMATPFISGTIALMLDADPTLTPDQIKQILIETATRMPGYADFEAGAGYVNTYAAVDKVINRSKVYGSILVPQFNATYTERGPAPEAFHVDYTPAALPGPGSANSRTFEVLPGMSLLDVYAEFDNAAESGDGNTIGLLLTDPNGVKYSSGIALPILDGPARQVVVKDPAPGTWLLEVRGVRGLAALPNVSLPTTGAALPGPVDGDITQLEFVLNPIADIQGHAAQGVIETSLKNRMMDTFPDGTFKPDAAVTRGDLARTLALNTPLRQTVPSSPRFRDIDPTLGPIAEAVTAKGSTLRDWNFAPDGMMSASGTSFNPSASAPRIDLAVALVRGLGLDAEAKAKAGQPVTVVYSGQTLVLADNSDIPLALRGYVQIALDKGLLQAFFALEQGPFDFQPTLKARVKPNDTLTRAFLAYALSNFNLRFTGR